MELKQLFETVRPEATFIDESAFFGSPYDDKCPSCGAKVVMTCKCMIGSRSCENVHEWYRDKQTGRPIQGNGHK